MISSKILEQLEQLPESLQVEVLHYAEYLSSKYGETDDTAYLNSIPGYVDSIEEVIKSPRSEWVNATELGL
ncbi:MAG: DUF2281 domain-containing protein [Snowella sp.]|jgi:hypothetical protein|nr:DUF2281 domain-containing protein [Snowella sp.]